MKIVSGVGWVVVALLIACWGQDARAELPPHAYPDPERASEVVDIEVLSASKSYRLFASNFNVSRYKVKVVGRVIAVHQTATGLKPGSKITIRYDAHRYNDPGFCGRGSFPFLHKGAVYKAHLITEGRDGCYSPWGAPCNAFERKSKIRSSADPLS